MDTIIIGQFEPEIRRNLKEEQEMLKEREMLIKAVASQKFPYKIVPAKWPRDTFTVYQDNIYERKRFGNYADGGYVLTRPNFTIVCSELSLNDNGEREPEEYRYKMLKKLYKSHFHILPPLDLNLNTSLRHHIDMVLLPIPQKALCFTDEIYYQANKESLNSFAEKTNLNIKPIYNDYANPSWPCNTLIIEDDKKQLHAFVNTSGNSDFIKILRSYDINIIGLPFQTNCVNGGSIHCATNTIPLELCNSINSVFQK